MSPLRLEPLEERELPAIFCMDVDFIPVAHTLSDTQILAYELLKKTNPFGPVLMGVIDDHGNSGR